MTKADPIKPLTGWRVLVPRGGLWGDAVAESLRAQGALPVVTPLINFAPAVDQASLDVALERLAAGEYDWLTVTSATAIDVLYAHGVQIPERTRIAAVGGTTADALVHAGYRVDLAPAEDNSALGMAATLLETQADPARILSLRSEISRPVVAEVLTGAGHDVDSVVAYRMVGVPASERVLADVASGRINAILVTVGTVAEQIRAQFPSIPETTLVVPVGPAAAEHAVAMGLPQVDVAHRDTVELLLDTVAHLPLPHAGDEFEPASR